MSKNIKNVPASALSVASTVAIAAASVSKLPALEIDPAVQEKLIPVENSILNLGRRSTEQSFELGELYATAMALLPPGHFEKWLKLRLGVAPRTGHNYAAIHHKLQAWRDQLVDQSAGPTVLVQLTTATPEQVEEAIELGEEKGRLTVADVKALLAEGKEREGKAASTDVFFAGGTAGLKGLIAVKARDGMKLFPAHVEAICELIRIALGKKRVIKEQLFKEIFEWARLAREELESLALFVDAELDSSLRHRPKRFPMKSHWWHVSEVLYKLGGIDAWPKSAAVRGWLELEVLPVLEWVTSRERRPKWPLPDKTEVAPVVRELDDAFDQGMLEDALEAEAGEEAEPSRHHVDDVPPLAADEADEDYDDEEDLEVDEDYEGSDEPEVAEEDDFAGHGMR